MCRVRCDSTAMNTSGEAMISKPGRMVLADPRLVEAELVEPDHELEVAFEGERRVLADGVKRGEEDAEAQGPVHEADCTRRHPEPPSDGRSRPATVVYPRDDPESASPIDGFGDAAQRPGAVLGRDRGCREFGAHGAQSGDSPGSDLTRGNVRAHGEAERVSRAGYVS